MSSSTCSVVHHNGCVHVYMNRGHQNFKDESQANVAAWQHSCILPSQPHVDLEAEADL